MQEIRGKYVPPSVRETAFNCPHCGALAKQFWFSTHLDRLKSDETPMVLDADGVKGLRIDEIEIEDEEKRTKAKQWAKRMASGHPFLEQHREPRSYNLNNVSVSHCYNCEEVAIWIYEQLVWPRRGEAPLPNPDLPNDVRADYDEASTILDLSPRGAAALLRLTIQKLCVHLGEAGKNINDDIATLVKKGLDVRIQQALDVVRVIGNNAVHPGQIELRDDRATAEKLFALVNLIAERMISEPKHVEAMFTSGGHPPFNRPGATLGGYHRLAFLSHWPASCSPSRMRCTGNVCTDFCSRP
jgi:hypothetical protein